MFYIVTLLGVALFIGAAFLAIKRIKARKQANLPTTWVTSGKAPAFQAEALQIIAKHTPGMPQAGLITWVEGPFQLGPNHMAAGVTWSANPINVQLTYADKIYETALVHELGHAWSMLTNQGFGESPADMRFVKWISDLNAEIKQKVG